MQVEPIAQVSSKKTPGSGSVDGAGDARAVLPRPTLVPAGISVSVGLLGLVAFVWFARFFDGVSPIRNWFFFDIGRIWLWELLLTASCASFGYCVLDRVLRVRDLPALEKLTYALCIGLVGFVAGMYAGGYLALFGPTFAVLLPLALLLSGVDRLWLTLASLRRESAPRLSRLALLASGFGVLGLGLLYLGVLAPDALNYDSVWAHLPVSQDYAREGRIIPFEDWLKNIPHLGSVVNTWAFLVPGFEVPPQRWMMALHNEFTVFVWTLIGVAAGARWLAGRPGARGLWAAFFLFPSIYVYDGNMGGAADHYLAFFAVPVFLAAVRFLLRPSLAWGVLAGAFAAGAILTKLQAVYFIFPIAIAIGGRSLQLFVANARRRATSVSNRELLKALGAGTLTSVAVLSLHFGKNAYYFGNPFHPMAQDLFPGASIMPDAHLHVSNLIADWAWQPRGPFLTRLAKALELLVTFSFEPHYTFNGNIPTFGSLFTLLLPALLFLRRAKLLWFGAAVVSAAVFFWAWTYPVDRNLQTFLPLMVAVTAALLVRIWELGVLPRLAVSLLIALQLVWGTEWAFSGVDRVNGAVNLIRSSEKAPPAQRYAGYRREYLAVDAALPKDAFVLLHLQHGTLGIDKHLMLDWAGFQGLIDYRRYQTPREFHLRLRELGITHVIYSPRGGIAAPTKQEAVIFAAYAAMNSSTTQDVGGFRVFPVAKTPPPVQRPYRVAVWKLDGYASGEYAISDLSVLHFYPPWLKHFPPPRQAFAAEADFEARLPEVDAVIFGPRARAPSGAEWAAFADLGGVREYTVYVRKSLIGQQLGK